MITATPARRTAPALQARPRTITVLGATGSIGTSTADLLRRHRSRFRVEAITANRNAAALAALAREFGARFAAVGDRAAYATLKEALAGSGIEAAAGEAALVEAAQRPADWVLGAITGASGLKATLAAVERGAVVALANKESLVCAGGLFMKRAAACSATVLPVDSEHNAIFQALSAGRREDVHRIVLTASGGPFRLWTAEQIRHATPEQALKHPNWSMGAKVTIDSATLMNKGLEVIEARHLFALKPNEIAVLVHPQSIVHGMVEFRDGSLIAQLGPTDMRVPISHCLAWPERLSEPAPRLDWSRIANLTFEEPDLKRFPALRLAQEAVARGGAAPTVLNAANEVAVAEFLGRRLGFAGIPALVEATLDAAESRGLSREPESIEEALDIDHVSRSLAAALLPDVAIKAS
jgi:1-deoxy-D-xylulose-5-phosphate reductoisomerase